MAHDRIFMRVYAEPMVKRIAPKNPDSMRVYLKEWREHYNLTQEQVAERIGTTKGTISRMESKTREPNLGYLAAFSEAINRNIGVVFRDPAHAGQEELLQNATPEQLNQALQLINSLRTGTNG